jgi:hypothetical protein
MNPETRFIHKLKAALPSHWMFTRIETTTENGVPDICVGNHLGDIWIEAKRDLRAPLRKEQKVWQLRAHTAGRLVVVARPCADGKIQLENNYDYRIWTGTPEFLKDGLTAVQIHHQEDKKARFL